MKSIILVIDSFYNCCNLPVNAVDNNFNEIYKKGYNNEMDILFYNSTILCDINKSEFKSEFLTFSYPDDINFVATPISKLDRNKGFYIIGPFNLILDSSKNYLDIPHRTNTSIKYLYKLLINIHNDIFSKGRIDLNFNSYVRKAVDYTIKNYNCEISVDVICKQLNINKSYFCKIFKDETGYTFCNFLNFFRVEKSKELLKNTDMCLLDIAISVGFNSQSYYTVIFKRFTGQTPIMYRNK